MEQLERVASGSKVPHGQTHVFALRNIMVTGTLMRSTVGVAICLTLPALPELIVGIVRWEEECGKRLATWLVTDGTLSIVVSVLLISYTYCGFLRRIGDSTVHEYVIHRERDGIYNQESERNVEKVRQSQSRLECCQLCALVLPCCLLLLGAAWRYNVGNCNQELKDWTLRVLIFRACAPCIICCCTVPIVLCCSGHVARHMERAAEEQAASTSDASESESLAPPVPRWARGFNC